MTDMNKLLNWYEGATWLRALVQLPPGGGSVDVLLAGKATELNQKRLNELIEDVNRRVQALEGALPVELLQSEVFFEVFRTAAEIVARSADPRKREVVAEYLSGMIRNGVVTDLGAQVLEDLRFLQPLHFQVLAALSPVANSPVSKQHPPESLASMPVEVYEKAMSDLDRLGFLRYNTAGIGAFGGGGGHWETTDYVRVFRQYIEP